LLKKEWGDGLANIPEAAVLSEEAKERIRARLDQKESVFVEAQRVVPIEKRMGSITERVVQIANNVIEGNLPPKDAYSKIQSLVRDLPDGIVANYLAGQIGLAINWDIGGDKEEMIQTLISRALAEETPSNDFRNINGFETLVPQATDLTQTERFDVRERYNEQVYSNFPQSLDGPLMFTHLSQLIRNHSTYLFQIAKLLPTVPQVQRKKIVETYERLGLLLLDIAESPVMEGIFESQFGQSGFNRYRANTIIEGMDRSLGTHIFDTTSGLLQTPHAHALREQRRARLDRFSKIEEAHNGAVSSRSNELEVAVPQAIYRANEEIIMQEKANKAVDDDRKQALEAIEYVESQILAKKGQIETEKAPRAGIMKFLQRPDQNRILALENEIAALVADKSAKDRDFPAPVDPIVRENLTKRRQRLIAFTQATSNTQRGVPQANTVTHGG